MRSGPIVWIPLVVSIAVIVWGISDAFRLSTEAWERAGRKRSTWIVIMLLFGPLAVLLYVGTVRQQIMHPERYVEVDGVSAVDR